MRHFTDNNFMVCGGECEITNLSVSATKRALAQAGINGVWVTTDGTYSVTAEIVFPPLPIELSQTWEFYDAVYNALEDAGAEINQSCGHHLHISTANVEGLTPIEFFNKAIYCAEQTDYSDNPSQKYPSGTWYGDAMSFELLKDVIYRYGTHQQQVNQMLARSRHENNMARSLYGKVRHTDFESISNVNALNAHLGGKYSGINVSNFANGTIEFRQHQGTLNAKKMQAWAKLILQLFKWSDSERLAYDSQTQTNVQPFRVSSRNGVAWEMCRSENGASVQEMMDRIGWTPNNVRRTISEWRSRFGDDVVVTHSQQSNGASYGDGDTHTRYQVLETVGSGVSLLPENRIGQTSIFSGLDDDTFEFMQDRIIELGHRA